MTSTAISSQGSTVSIGGVAGAAKVITGITATNPPVVASVAHGLNRGDIVTMAAILGMTQLNGLSAVVQYVSPNSFVLGGIDATAFTPYVSGGTATPATWTAIANVKTFTAFDGSASEIDTSNLQSTAKEFLLGLMDSGTFSMELDMDTADPGQMALLAAQVSAAKKQFKLVLPSNATATFFGFAKKVSSAGGVDQAMKRSVDVRISGPVVWS